MRRFGFVQVFLRLFTAEAGAYRESVLSVIGGKMQHKQSTGGDEGIRTLEAGQTAYSLSRGAACVHNQLKDLASLCEPLGAGGLVAASREFGGASC